MDSPDLQTKYHKLASEYSKLRAQNQVLKKAVIDEQGRSNQLKDVLKTRDQSVRKADQEIDSLSFRNQQLAKRLMVLQDDVDVMKNCKIGKEKLSIDSSQTSIADCNVFAEELQSKIMETARLHTQIDEIESKHTSRIAELENDLEELKRTQQNVIDKIEQKQSSWNTLQSDNFESVKNKGENNFATSLNSSSSSLSATLEASSVDSATKVCDLSKQERRKEPPQSLDVMPNAEPSFFNGNSTIQTKDAIFQLKSLVKELSTAFQLLIKIAAQKIAAPQEGENRNISSEFAVWECLSGRMSDLNEEFLSTYPENTTAPPCVKNLRLNSVTLLSEAVTDCAGSLRRTSVILAHRCVCEDGGWRGAVGGMAAAWAALSPFVSSVGAHCDGRTSLTESSICRIVSLLIQRLTKLHLAARDLLTTWKRVTPFDNQKNTILLPLDNLEQSLEKICNVVSRAAFLTNGDASSAIVPMATVDASAGEWSCLASASSTPATTPCLTATATPSLEFVTPLASKATTPLGSKGTKTPEERDCEYWRLEHRLLAHRHDKQTKKCAKLETELASLRPSAAESVSLESPHQSSHVESTSLVGEVISEASKSEGNLNEEREKEIRAFFNDRCAKLNSKLAFATSQAALFMGECNSLTRRLTLSDNWRDAAEQQTETARREIDRLGEELKTTSRNYEEQMSAMSELLADLNERIAKQEDQIQSLKFDLKKKSKK